jgi:type II secretory ATPase GspE/PulE/Tfp pilus assembly ATPase PilB-like protein
MGAGIRSVSLFGSKEDTAIRLLDSSGRSIKEIYGHAKGQRQDSHILDLTEQIIANALEEQVSDILIDPKDELVSTVRFRTDGILRTVKEFDPVTCQAVVNSIKAVSSMDISERRRPQDGAFVAKTANGTVSFRVASAGVLNGEKVSVRVLNQNAGMFTLDSIGLTEKQRMIVENVVSKPTGMLLMCGPTGSGKTTTLYAMLNSIDLFTRNVITVEDPIEYVLPNASQIEVNPKALRASQTGHLVLATIHSSNNAAALVRLLDLGVTPLLLSSGLDVLSSQRLLRRLCNNCKTPAELTQSQIYDFRRKGINYRNIYHAGKCDRCHETGYRGRIAIFDILVLTDELKSSIANNQLSVTQLKKDGDKKGRSNLYKQGLRVVVSGATSLEELKRVVG